MKAYTSRSRFDERRNFTGVFQQMGRVSLDADWNEEVLIRTRDVRRRTHDLAHGSPDDGFLISDEHLVDRIGGTGGWVGNGLAPDDQRTIPASVDLDRREPEGLPHVIRGQGHRRLRRALDAILDLNAVGLTPSGSFAAETLIFSVRFERPPNDDDPTAVGFFLEDDDGAVATVAASFGENLPETWHHQRVIVADLAGIDTGRIAAWGLDGLSPRALTWIDALRATDAALAHGVDEVTGPDLVIRGGDGTIAGAGRMLLDGVRTYLERDVRYGRQPDLPDPPALAQLPTDGSRAHLVYLDVWEQLVTALDDDFLHEPALDGLDTTVRLQFLSQVKVHQDLAAAAPVALPAATGGGRLTTNVEPGLLPDRYPTPPLDPCRDRCLFTESASTGEGYTGAHNLHLRIEILHPTEPVFVWSRDNGSTRFALAADAPAEATSLSVSNEDALSLRAGDLVVISDRRIDRQPEGPRVPVLRAIKGIDSSSGTLYLEEDDFALTDDPVSLPAGGAIDQSFAVADKAYVRRWDGADLLRDDVRYNLPDGINFRFTGSGWRRGDYWSLTARVENADGDSRGRLEQLTDAPVHGPVHHHVALSRVTRTAGGYRYQDLRPRFLPLTEVRDRLAELVAKPTPTGAFTLIIGDGVRTFGDIDQDLAEGVTGDEVLQSAVQKLCAAGGGSIYLRAGTYALEKPVELAGCSRLRILGDGDASEVRVTGAGGAFILDGCGVGGEVSIERLSLLEVPREDLEFGEGEGESVEEFLPPLSEIVGPFQEGDLVVPGNATPSFVDNLVQAISTARMLTKRPFNSVLATLRRLREIQRANPGQPLEDQPEAVELMSRLRRLPHGLVTVSDSRRVSLSHLSVESREATPEAGGVFLTGSCSQVRISHCRILAAAAILAAPYGPYLSRSFFSGAPRSGLYLDDLILDENRLSAQGEGSSGISLTGATVRGLRIADNRIEGFNVGIAVGDRSDLEGRGLTGADISRNRLLGCEGLGMDLEGRGLELTDNLVENTAPVGLFQAGIRVQGSGIRVRGCRVTLPGAGAGALASSPLALCAGIVVGAGADSEDETGFRGPGAVEDVEIAGCRFRGQGAASSATGVLIGGPQPVLNVRVRDCGFSDLGDAAVRVWGQGGRCGRIRVDDNRIERVAVADVPGSADAGAAIAALSPSVSAELEAANVDMTDPGALLAALVASPSNAVTGPLDGVLRWVSLRTLRGALVFDQVEDGEIVANRISGVGADDATRGPDVRTCAIATVGATDLVIEGNQIEHVAAERTTLPPPPDGGEPARPAVFDALLGLDLAAADERVDRTDVHGATTALRRLILAYGGGTDPERMRLGRRVYGAMDALEEDLDAFGGRGAKIAASLVMESDEMRTAQGRDDHSAASDRVRATLSRAASFTAGDDQAQAAWEAVAQFDLAVVDRDPVPAAQRLQDSAAQLADGLPERQSAIESTMAEVLSRAEALAAAEEAEGDADAEREALEQAQIAAATELGALGEWRDAAHLRASAPRPGELFGAKQTIVRRFAERIDAEAARLAADADAENRDILESLRQDTDALVESIAGSNASLARTLEADWNALERSVTDEKRTRLQSTLAVVRDWTVGGSGTVGETESSSAADIERQAEAGNAALMGMVAGHIDSGIGKLLIEPEGVKTKNLKVLEGAGGQLRNLVSDDPESADLASKAGAAIRAAATDPQRRSSELAKARSFLGSIRRRVEGLTLRLPSPPKRKPTWDKLDQRLSALAALVLGLPRLGSELRHEGVALVRAQFERVIDAAGLEGRNRSSAQDRISDAAAALERSSASGYPAAVHALMRELDRTAAAVSSQDPPARLKAAAVLIRAASLGADPGEDEPTRLLRVQAYLRDRTSALTQSSHHALARHDDLSGLMAGLEDMLTRIALGEKPAPAETAAPFFSERLAPADGIFAVAIQGRLRVADNQVQHAVRGATLLGATGHPLAGPGTEVAGLVLQLSGNRIDGCALGGLELRPSGTVSLNLTGNEVFASAGVGEDGPAGIGQSVALIAGSGELVVQGNLFQGNGHRHPRAVLNELTVDWHGEAVVRGNSIRHLGGGAGGAGLLLLAEPDAGTLPVQLATAPFLGIEPPPKPTEAGPDTGFRPQFTLPVLQTAFGDVLRAAPSSRIAEGRIISGRLVQRVSTARIAPRILTLAKPERFAGLASDNARRYLDRELVSPLGHMLDFVRLRPYRKPSPPPPPPEQRTFHVEGNDIAAYGPALLLVGEEAGDLISSSVVGNGLHSEGGTGAAYLRYVDNLVFASNRCQSPGTVNVVVIRALSAALSVTGNLVLGREPVTPPVPVTPPKPKAPSGPGRVTLNLPLGTEGSLIVPIDSAKLRGSIESFTGEARKAFSNVLVERAAAEQVAGPFLEELELREVGAPDVGEPPDGGGEPPPPDAAPAAPTTGAAPASDSATNPTVTRSATPTVADTLIASPNLSLAASRPFSATLSSASAKYSIAPFEGVQSSDTVLQYIQNEPNLSSKDVEAVLRGTAIQAFADDTSRQAFKNQVDGIRLAMKAKELERKTSADKVIEQAEAATVFNRVGAEADTEAGALATMTKLFTAQGFNAERTAAEVQLLIEKSEGSATKALGSLQKDIFASGDARPEARKAIENLGLIEKVLTDELFTSGEAVAEPEEEAPEPPPPDPYQHSLVIFGGTTVAAVGNSTTAGSLIQDAQETVELNL